jgi:hypothetical protein
MIVHIEQSGLLHYSRTMHATAENKVLPTSCHTCFRAP